MKSQVDFDNIKNAQNMASHEQLRFSRNEKKQVATTNPKKTSIKQDGHDHHLHDDHPDLFGHVVDHSKLETEEFSEYKNSNVEEFNSEESEEQKFGFNPFDSSSEDSNEDRK